MGDYSKKLTFDEYQEWVKKVKKHMIDKDMKAEDIAQVTGYTTRTVYDSLRDYERCSRFFVASISELMEEHEKTN